MAMTVETALQNNQSILQNFGLGEEIDELSAEIISGGCTEIFTITNETDDYVIPYYVDGTLTKSEFKDPHTSSEWTTGNGGIIEFDGDGRSGVINWKKYNLENGKVYAFRENKSTCDPYDLDLYCIG